MARGYRSYRGRRRKSKAFPVIMAVFILLLSLALLYLGLNDAIVFSSEGILIHNPFAKKEPEPSPSPSPTSKPDLVIESPTPEKTPEPSPTPTPKQSFSLNAAYLPDISDPVATAGIIQLADKGVINSVIIDMKHDDGTLGYISANQYAVQAGANVAEHDAREIVEQFRDAGLYLVARISAFKDNLVPRKVQSTSVKVQSGVIWLDRDYHGWMNPYLQEAQDYVSDIAVELADMGFDEILLENCCFPTIGRPQLIAYGEYEAVSKTETISNFAQDLVQRLAGKNVLLSISLSSSTILEGTDEALGHDATSLYGIADRIYTDIGIDSEVSSTVYDAIYSISRTSLGEPTAKFVPVIDSPRSYDDPSASENIQVAIGTFVRRGHGWVIRDRSGLYPPAGW